MKLLNIWRTTATKREYYNEGNLVYQNGEYRIFKQFNESFIYSFKDIAFNNLAGLNKPHLDRVARRERPIGDYSPQTFMYDRAIENLDAGLKM